MDNNLNNKNIDTLTSSLNGKIDRRTIAETMKTGNTDALINKLSDKDKEKLYSVLNDKKAIEEMLKSPKAAAIIKMLSGGGKNG